MCDYTTPAEYVTIREIVFTFVVDFIINLMFDTFRRIFCSMFTYISSRMATAQNGNVLSDLECSKNSKP